MTFNGKIKLGSYKVCANIGWLETGNFWFCLKKYFYWKRIMNKGIKTN